MAPTPARRILATAVILFAAAALAWSGIAVRAADTAKIDGALKDSDGAALAQANVTLKPPSGADKKATTDAKGAFSFTSLPAGKYSVTIEAPGYQTTRYTNLQLTEGQTRQFDFSLRPGAVSSAIEVDVTRPAAAPDSGRLYSAAPGLPTGPAPGTLPQGNGVISGRILNYTGAPASTVRVGVVAADAALYSSPRVMTHESRTDNLGFYRLELPPGRYFVVAGSETFTQDGSYLDRPVYFPGVADASRALAFAVGAGTSDTADFRLDGPTVVYPLPLPVPYPLPYYGPYRVSGQVIFTPLVYVPMPYPQYQPYPGASSIYPYPYPYPDRVAVGLEVILQSGGNVARGCGAGRTAYSAGVAYDGQFEFRSVSAGVYDVCVIQTGVVLRGRGAASSAGGRSVVYGPSSIVVDHNISGLRLDIGGAWILPAY